MNLDENELNIISNLNIDALILFGSQAQGISNEKSDYDFFVIGSKNSDTYDVLINILSIKINKLVDIDIVFNDDAPMELKNHVITYGQVLYQKTDNVFSNFKEQVMSMYQDFAPYRQLFQQATLARID